MTQEFLSPPGACSSCAYLLCAACPRILGSHPHHHSLHWPPSPGSSQPHCQHLGAPISPASALPSQHPAEMEQGTKQPWSEHSHSSQPWHPSALDSHKHLPKHLQEQLLKLEAVSGNGIQIFLNIRLLQPSVLHHRWPGALIKLLIENITIYQYQHRECWSQSFSFASHSLGHTCNWWYSLPAAQVPVLRDLQLKTMTNFTAEGICYFSWWAWSLGNLAPGYDF